MPALELPAPRHQGGKPLIEALMLRRSIRAYDPKPLPPQLLSDLLWAANGVNRPATGDRTAPYWRHIMVIDIYAAMAEGVWLYDPSKHSLVPLSERRYPGRHRVAGLRRNRAAQPDLCRAWRAHDGISPVQDRRLYASVDTGFIGQNVYLFCASEGLATVFRGAVPYDKLAKRLQLPPEQFVTFAQTVGYPAA